jgi:two-component system, chemotaxis family, protein-glutamate methylesterase/glutaminase
MRVLIADDAVAYRAIISRALERLPGVEVVGVAANGRIALQRIEQLRPDLMTLDLEMPGIDGLELLRRLRAEGSDVGVIMLSAFTTQGAKATVEALALGAFDFVVKPSGGNHQANAEKLQRELRFKIEAFSKAREIRAILRGRPIQPVVPSVSPTQDDRCARRGGNEVTFPADRLAGLAVSTAVNSWLPSRAELVAIGVSTGGPQALAQLLPELPPDLAAPVVVVQHMPPMFTRSLADDLNARCALRVSEAADGQPVAPGSILIAPGGKQMKIENGDPRPIIRITDDPPENSCQPSVDYLFRSVAEVCGRRTLGILMTGMGNDGAAGCRLLSRRGATLLAQDEASCVVFGMPREPIHEGIAKAVSLADMAAEIIRLVGKPERHLAGNIR